MILVAVVAAFAAYVGASDPALFQPLWSFSTTGSINFQNSNQIITSLTDKDHLVIVTSSDWSSQTVTVSNQRQKKVELKINRLYSVDPLWWRSVTLLFQGQPKAVPNTIRPGLTNLHLAQDGQLIVSHQELLSASFALPDCHWQSKEGHHHQPLPTLVESPYTTTEKLYTVGIDTRQVLQYPRWGSLYRLSCGNNIVQLRDYPAVQFSFSWAVNPSWVTFNGYFDFQGRNNWGNLVFPQHNGYNTMYLQTYDELIFGGNLVDPGTCTTATTVAECDQQHIQHCQWTGGQCVSHRAVHCTAETVNRHPPMLTQFTFTGTGSNHIEQIIGSSNLRSTIYTSGTPMNLTVTCDNNNQFQPITTFHRTVQIDRAVPPMLVKGFEVIINNIDLGQQQQSQQQRQRYQKMVTQSILDTHINTDGGQYRSKVDASLFTNSVSPSSAPSSYAPTAPSISPTQPVPTPSLPPPSPSAPPPSPSSPPPTPSPPPPSPSSPPPSPSSPPAPPPAPSSPPPQPPTPAPSTASPTMPTPGGSPSMPGAPSTPPPPPPSPSAPPTPIGPGGYYPPHNEPHVAHVPIKDSLGFDNSAALYPITDAHRMYSVSQVKASNCDQPAVLTVPHDSNVSNVEVYWESTANHNQVVLPLQQLFCPYAATDPHATTFTLAVNYTYGVNAMHCNIQCWFNQTIPPERLIQQYHIHVPAHHATAAAGGATLCGCETVASGGQPPNYPNATRFDMKLTALLIDEQSGAITAPLPLILEPPSIYLDNTAYGWSLDVNVWENIAKTAKPTDFIAIQNTEVAVIGPRNQTVTQVAGMIHNITGAAGGASGGGNPVAIQYELPPFFYSTSQYSALNGTNLTLHSDKKYADSTFKTDSFFNFTGFWKWSEVSKVSISLSPSCTPNSKSVSGKCQMTGDNNDTAACVIPAKQFNDALVTIPNDPVTPFTEMTCTFMLSLKSFEFTTANIPAALAVVQPPPITFQAVFINSAPPTPSPTPSSPHRFPTALVVVLGCVVAAVGIIAAVIFGIRSKRRRLHYEPINNTDF